MHDVSALLLIASLTLALPLSPAGPGEDIINERPPVSRAELESRWGVSCTAASQDVRVLAALIRSKPSDSKVIMPLDTDSLLNELGLCAVIDKALRKRPGKLPGGYQEMHDALAEWSACREEGRSCEVYAEVLVGIVDQRDEVAPGD